MITYKASDVKYSWEHEAEPESPNLPVCAYIKEGKNSSDEGPEPDYDSILKRWKRDISMERYTRFNTREQTILMYLTSGDY